ncbi:MAG: hypothetical protein ABI851_08515 [Saprospiraceae bacterium]
MISDTIAPNLIFPVPYIGFIHFNVYRKILVLNKNFILLTALISLILCSISLSGQKYNTALGIRFGEDFGITLQQRIAKKTSIEGIINLYPNNKDLGFKVLLENHKSIITRRLNLYLGFGLHSYRLSNEVTSYPGGLSFVLGSEISIGRMNLSWDFLPSINLWNTPNTNLHYSTGFSFRYVLIKEPKKKFFRKYSSRH